MDAAHVAAYLQEHGLSGEIVTLPEPTPTVEAAARAAGTTVDRICKSVLFLANGEPLLVITSGTARVDYKRLADHVGLSRKRLKLADAETVVAVTGYPVGTVPPFGHKTRLRTLIDVGVLSLPEVFAGGGAIDTLLRITPAEIVRAARAEAVDVRASESAPAQES
jgi:prolyl-tRNA editing enzyme YbaK/EbsC (Cys-tRNA(Pro) deacylase)